MPYVIEGDCLDILRTMPDASFDALVTDPPAGIGFMGKAWDSNKGSRNQWVAWLSEVMAECLRVLKPGGHALVWALPRTSHWTATAVEDAGFEIRDVVMHLFGSGFPKSLNVSKAIEATENYGKSNTRSLRSVEQEGNGEAYQLRGRNNGILGEEKTWDRREYAPSSEAAKQWQGWGTALKPAAEHWILARKPLEGTVAANVLAYGTGAINIDGCRIKTTDTLSFGSRQIGTANGIYGKQEPKGEGIQNPQGRWPTNVTLDEASAEVLDAQSGTLKSGKPSGVRKAQSAFVSTEHGGAISGIGDSGGASRFFYVAKPSTRERNAGLEGKAEKVAVGSGHFSGDGRGRQTEHTPRANAHPTVKPIALMRYLCRLITPPNGIILDPFCGSGTTGCAATLEGFGFIGIEQDPEYAETARARITHWATAAETAAEKQPMLPGIAA